MLTNEVEFAISPVPSFDRRDCEMKYFVCFGRVVSRLWALQVNTLVLPILICLGPAFAYPGIAFPQDSPQNSSGQDSNIGHRTTTTRQLIPNERLGVTSETPLILGAENPANFRSPTAVIVVTADTVKIKRSGPPRTFARLSEDRNDIKNSLCGSLEDRLKYLSDPEGMPVSNIGVSLAITLSVFGKDYALLSYRPSEKRYMLISGYVEEADDETALVLQLRLTHFHGCGILLWSIPEGKDARINVFNAVCRADGSAR